jgi:hypothetical protein
MRCLRASLDSRVLKAAHVQFESILLEQGGYTKGSACAVQGPSNNVVLTAAHA